MPSNFTFIRIINSRFKPPSDENGTWVADQWSPCQADAPTQVDADGLCSGRRFRNVSCQVDGMVVPSPGACPDPAPATVAPCTTLCPQGCVVGPWGTWSPCETCEASKHRTRSVVVAPAHGGAPCPPLSEYRLCIADCMQSPDASLPEDAREQEREQEQWEEEEEKGSSSVRLRVGEWGACTSLLPGQAPSPSAAPDSSLYFARDPDATVPEASREVDLGPSNAILEVYPPEALRAEEEQEEQEEEEQQQKDAERSKGDPAATAEQWLFSPMLKPLGKVGHREADLPSQSHADLPLMLVMQGSHADFVFVRMKRCLIGRGRVAARTRTCVVPRDCSVGDWSTWSTIIPGCVAPSGLVVREVRERRRTGKALQHGDGVPCPHLLERHTLPDPSLQPCDTRYQWVSSAWGPCVASIGVEEAAVRCGGGVQTRQLTCVRAADHVPVADDLCVHVEPPPRVQRCEVGCERDCVVGPWSAWGVCTPTDCTASPPPATPGFQRRRREIVVTPSSGGAECPPLEEQSECHEAQCHQWVLGPWSSCEMDNLAHSCGPGHQARNATCLDSAGVPAPTEECRVELGPALKERECHVPCAFDCVVGSWSAWSPCTRPCASQLQVGYTQRNTSVVAPPGPGGLSCPAPDELTQVETCRVEPCGGAAWVAGDWRPCTLPARASCGPGRQTRPLLCRDHLNNTLPAYRCGGLTRPSLERACEVSCGTACTVTSWSEWSPCLSPDPCPMDGVLVSSVQRRWRRVLVAPSDGGSPCPPLDEERGCAHAPVTCSAHHWRAGPWSRCALADDVECGLGFRVRRVECLDAVGNVVEATHCLLGDKMVPESSAECEVSCTTPCVTSTWTPWTSCPVHPPCGHFSSRTRELLDESADNPLCQSLILEEKEACQCHSFYTRHSGSWSSCLVGAGSEDDSKGTGSAGVSPLLGADSGWCGVGRRYRALLCNRDDGVLAHPSACGHDGIESEPCMVECPSDCRVGAWGAWSACNASCGAGIQTRRREVRSGAASGEVVQPSLWGGRPCPETREVRACWGECSSSWVPGGWTECQLGPKQDCGSGTQTRSVRCMRESATGLEVEVPPEECDATAQLPRQQACRVSCPGECVVSSWSSWSQCPQGCPGRSHRSRSREVVRRPVGNVATCPQLVEEEPCLRGVSCWLYSWHVGNWTSCVPLGHSSCGEGVRNRPVTCIRSGDMAVPERFCPRDTRPTPQETWCYVDCPIDCEVTPWTPWDDSKCSCGENSGEMIRHRYLSVNPSESGRPCPANLQESRPCPAIPCYTWERGPWSQCKLEGGECGHGYVERNVSCVGPGGQTVAPQLCLALVHVGGHTWPYLARALDLNTKDGCYVPCEGDCELTEWTSWSHCHRDCYRGHQGGTQTRSRAVLTEGTPQRADSRSSCPGPLWETRPCLAGPCLNFTWEIRNGTVECVRGDGLVVTGGCEGTPRPCLPECTVRGSVCSGLGACVCQSGLRPRYSEKQRFRLTACVPVLNLTFPLPLPLSEAKYLPEDINVWMFAMVGVGSAFVVFVAISMYLLCQSPREQTSTPVTLRRQKTLRHRPV
ncbi:thrombospondin type-1 domain-containing protein 7B-like [Penaeus indicus]|uniref:thrombospondin type-1 domain-containing protein 7B-like n=1 Tax=Penaeus indicus TaxID=29960 RepID=UPI00300C1D12